MVCQAASQTRFRALKHENGIAGSSTIIVRVIACFQPLRECQRASPGTAVKLCLGDLLVMGSNPETASLHMQGLNISVIYSNLSRIFYIIAIVIIHSSKNDFNVIVLIEWEEIVEPGYRICNLDGNHQI
ncbi:hypothetical protein GmHk_04G009919 [Glycine max]|nr:hypothetical protein GmHk_04G009919 [Glycine max]